MTVTPQLTAAQQLLPIKQVLGRPYRLLPYESVHKVTVTEEKITLVLKVYQYTETQREVRFTKSGFRMFAWSRQDDGRWKPEPLGLDGEQLDMTMWDVDFAPYIECRYGTHRSVKDYYEQLEWEAETYRPGTSRTPLDSFHRSVDGNMADTTPAMFKHWTGVDQELMVLYRSERQD